MKHFALALVALVAWACKPPASQDASDAKSVEAKAPATTAPTPKPTPEPLVLAAGTTLGLVFDSTVSSATARVEDAVVAHLADDVKASGEVVLGAGTEVRGHVVAAERSGRVKGRARLVIEFDEVEAHGRTYKVDTTPVAETAAPDTGRDAKIIGGAAGAGAIIGGLAGGGAGALKGLLIGGAAGTGGVLVTRGHEVVFDRGSRHNVKLEKSLHLR
jgi:hypothetical protein